MGSFDEVMCSLQARWARLQPRERLVLLSGLGVLILIVAYLLLWEPATRGIRQLQAELPALRTQNAAMQAMAQEAVRLRGNAPSAGLLPSDQLPAVRQSLEQAGLKAMVESVREGRVRVRIDDADYSAWAAWLANAESQLGARTASASITALSAGNVTAASGHVRVELQLDFSRPVPGSNKS